MKDGHFTNETQEKLATELLNQGYTVWCDRNSEIAVFLRGGQTLSSAQLSQTPYTIQHVIGCSSDERFSTRMTLRADWTNEDT